MTDSNKTGSDWKVSYNGEECTAKPLPIGCLDDEYQTHDISSEEWREVIFASHTYRIDQPVTLIMRKGGRTHRVVDANGVAHCYVAPESGLCTIRWKSKKGLPPVKL